MSGIKDNIGYNELVKFLKDLADMVEEKGHDKVWVAGVVSLVASTAIQNGVNIDKENADYFTRVLIDDEIRLARVSVTSDLDDVINQYLEGRLEDVYEGVLYVTSNSKTKKGDVGGNDGKGTVH